MSDTPIQAEVLPPEGTSQAVALRPQQQAVGRAMTIDELHANLEFVRNVMRREMKEGQDYGKIPGCGDKPALLQPGAQKLLMVFNLCEQVRKEDCRDLPGGHREYAFTICVRAPNGKEWDGVGTCSTMESKYRYRQQNIRCPKCGKETVRKSKQAEGWYCWAKIGGCGANFPADAEVIVSQPRGRIEHDNPADFWNTVRKMAFKRALVAGSINATNTSELWTQDIEDMADNARGSAETPPGQPDSPKPPSAPTPTPKPPPSPKSAPILPPPVPFPTEQSRQKMLDALKANPGQPNYDIVTEFFRKLSDPCPLMPKEPLEHLELRFVPATVGQMKDLAEKLADFGNGGRPAWPYRPHVEPASLPPGVTTPAQVVPRVVQETEKKAKDPEWWKKVIVPIPHKNEKRDAYLRHPDTLGSLYDLRHGQDEEGQAARQRLWGIVENHSEAKPWVGRDGKEHAPSATDIAFAEAVRAFKAWWEQNHPGERL